MNRRQFINTLASFVAMWPFSKFRSKHKPDTYTQSLSDVIQSDITIMAWSGHITSIHTWAKDLSSSEINQHMQDMENGIPCECDHCKQVRQAIVAFWK